MQELEIKNLFAFIAKNKLSDKWKLRALTIPFVMQLNLYFSSYYGLA